MQLREAARTNDAGKAAQLAAQIPDYPAPGYLEYFTIKPQLFDSQGHARIDAPDAPVLSFLQRYDGQAIADRMRNDYLVVLGGRHDWRNFEQQYSRFVLNDDTQVKCYALEARASRGENVADAARALLVDPKWYGDGCVDLIGALASSQQFTSDDVWQQIRLAYEQNYTSTGAKIVDALGQERPDPTLFDNATNTPPLYLARGVDAEHAGASADAARDHAHGAQRSGDGRRHVQLGRAEPDAARARDRLGHDRLSGGARSACRARRTGIGCR